MEINDIEPITSNALLSRTLRALHIRSATHDQLVLSTTDRIDEETAIRDKLIELRKFSSRPEELDEVIERMNNGRLRLVDKHASKKIMVSNPKANNNFDFTRFSGSDVAHLMRAGHNAALKTLRQIGLSTAGIPLIRP